MVESKIADLLKEVREVTVHYEKLIGAPATRTRQMIDRYGAVDALSRMAINSEIQSGFKTRAMVKSGVWRVGHAAFPLTSLIISSPSLNLTPSMTLPSCRKPRSRFQDCSALIPIF